MSKRGDVKLGDFGIAHAQRRESKTQVGTLKGKYGYMSPEQVVGRPVDARSDLFAVGVLFAELLTGRRLFSAPADLDVLLKVRDVKLDRLDKYGADLPPALDKIVRHSLKKSPDDRFQSAAAFRDELADYLFATGQRVRPNDLRAFAAGLFDDNADAAARMLQEARRMEAPKQAKAAETAAGVAVGATAGPPAAAAPAPAPAPAPATAGPPAAPPTSFPSTPTLVSDVVSDAPTAETSLPTGGWPEDDSLERSSVRGFTPVARPGEPSVHTPALRPMPTGRPTTHSDVGRFVSAAPKRPPDSAGDVSIISPMRLFCDLALAGETGLLQFGLDDVQKEIFLVGGAPESVSSSNPSERFGEYLVARKVLGPSDLDLALSMLPHYNGKLGDTLVALGLLRPLDVFRLLSEQVRDRVIDVFMWSEGTFAFYRGATNRQENFPLGLDTFEILGASVLNLPFELCERRFAEMLDYRPIATGRGRVEPEAFHLGPTPREVLALLDGSRTLRDWMAQFGDREELLTFLRSLYLLVETDLAELD
jgi:serine/threonine-protein kinase